MSCGQIALKKLGIQVDNYFASEIDKHAIAVTMHNFPNTIQLGDVTKVSAKDLPKIDLLIGGSPCQGFSFAGKQLAFDDPRSVLFFEFVRLWHEVKERNPEAKFMLENVRMKKEHELIISKYMNVEPIAINSNLVSAQNRYRLYWTNIKNEPYGLFGDMRCTIPQPEDKGILLRDVLESEVDEKYFLSEKMLKYLFVSSSGKDGAFGPTRPRNLNEKGRCLVSTMHKQSKEDNYIVASRGRNPENLKSRQVSLHTEQMLEPRTDGKTNCLTSVQKDNLVSSSSSIRRLTPLECERLQTVPDNYTATASDTQRYKMLGNGWTVDVIAHIFSFLNH